MSTHAIRQRTLVVFDLDHTLTDNDTYVAFLLEILKARPVRLLAAPLLLGAVAVHRLGLRDNTWLKTMFLRVICAGSHRDFVSAVAGRFAEVVCRAHIRPGAAAALRAHQANGDRVVLATAGLDLYAGQIASRLGIGSADVVATRAEWRGDRLTGRLASPNCYGEAKVRALSAVLAAEGRGDVDIAYTDHHADLPLLRSAICKVAVNPTRTLRALIDDQRLDITVVDWADRRKKRESGNG